MSSWSVVVPPSPWTTAGDWGRSETPLRSGVGERGLGFSSSTPVVRESLCTARSIGVPVVPRPIDVRTEAETRGPSEDLR